MNSSIVYTVGDNLYLNITNRCSCACSFCIRQNTNTVGDSGNLWLDNEPTIDEILGEIRKTDINKYKEIVFCGYGEPFERWEDVILLCSEIKRLLPSAVLRINTNGHGNLIAKQDIIPLLLPYSPKMSISLNAPDASSYQKICSCKYGEEGYHAMLDFAEKCRDNGLDVTLSVVNILTQEQILECEKIARNGRFRFRVRGVE